LAAIKYPNTVTNLYQYDSLNRLTSPSTSVIRNLISNEKLEMAVSIG